MNRFTNEKLIGNKIIALALIVVFNATIKFAVELTPVVAFFTVPIALILLFSKENWVSIEIGEVKE